MAEGTDTQDKETRMKAQVFGTFTPPQTTPWDKPLVMPPLALLRQPFKGGGTVAYFYCNNCGMFGEIGRDLLDRFLDVVNENAEGPIWDASKRAQFDGRSKFIVAYGCPRCSPVTAMTVVDIPSGQDDAPDTHDAEERRQDRGEPGCLSRCPPMTKTIRETKHGRK